MNTNGKVTLTALAISICIACVSNAFALSHGNNITIYDGEDGDGYTGVGIGREDNETEKGMVRSQAWDLEGFFLKGNVLTMMGGFNFKSGVSGYPSYTSGDIFISTDANFGSPIGSSDLKDGSNNIKEIYGYEYALAVNWNDLSFKTYKLDPASTTTTVYYSANETGTATSNPWRYVSGGDEVGAGSGTGGDLLSNAIVAEYDLKGLGTDNKHYSVSFDLSSIFDDADLYGKEFYTHFTMGCGNDNLIGHDIAPVPEPSTLALLGAGLLGAGLYRRRKMK